MEGENQQAESTASLVVASKVKEKIRTADLQMAADFPAALSQKVDALLEDALKRAKANNRKTVRPEDV